RGMWKYNDYTSTTQAATAAVMSTPVPGSAITSTTTFTWSAGVHATAYWLDVGTAQGQGNIFGQNVGLVTSRSVNIPGTGGTMYVRLWARPAGHWVFNDYAYVIPALMAAMSTPAPGSVLSGSAVTFTWLVGAGSAYWLDVGTSQGSGNIFGQNVGLATTQAVTGIPTNGNTIFVRLW